MDATSLGFITERRASQLTDWLIKIASADRSHSFDASSQPQNKMAAG